MNNKGSPIINIIITIYNRNSIVTESNNLDDIPSPLYDDLTGLTIQLIAIEKLITFIIQSIKNFIF